MADFIYYAEAARDPLFGFEIIKMKKIPEKLFHIVDDGGSTPAYYCASSVLLKHINIMR